MHQPRTERTARAMKLGAYLLVLSFLLFAGTVALLGYAIYQGERPLALGALGMFVVAIILMIAYRIFAAQAHCPLCRGPVLAGSGAQRNRKAKRSLGSHRLRVARSIIFTNTFVCPYCSEPTRCIPKARPKSTHRRSSYRR